MPYFGQKPILSAAHRLGIVLATIGSGDIPVRAVARRVHAGPLDRGGVGRQPDGRDAEHGAHGLRPDAGNGTADSPSGRERTRPGRPAPGFAQGRAVRTVTLVTGDRVVLITTPGGRPQVTVVPATKGAAFQVMTVRNQVYVVPQSAAGNLGAPLELSLFDVDPAHRRRLRGSGKPLRLAVSYAPRTRHRAVPGFAPAGHGTVSVSRAGAGLFGRALAAQASAAMRPAGTAGGGLFAGISRIWLPGAVTARNRRRDSCTR